MIVPEFIVGLLTGLLIVLLIIFTKNVVLEHRNIIKLRQDTYVNVLEDELKKKHESEMQAVTSLNNFRKENANLKKRNSNYKKTVKDLQASVKKLKSKNRSKAKDIQKLQASLKNREYQVEDLKKKRDNSRAAYSKLVNQYMVLLKEKYNQESNNNNDKDKDNDDDGGGGLI